MLGSINTAGPLALGDLAITPSVQIGRGGAIVVDNSTNPAGIAFAGPPAITMPVTSSTLSVGNLVCTTLTTGGATSASLTGGAVSCTSAAATGLATQPRYSLRVSLAATQAINTSADTAIAFDTTDVTADGGGATNWGVVALPTSVFTIPLAGLYLIAFQVAYATSAVGARNAWVSISSSVRRWGEDYRVATTGFPTMVSSSFTYRMAAGATVSLNVNQSSGGSLNVLGDTVQRTHLHLVRLTE